MEKHKKLGLRISIVIIICFTIITNTYFVYLNVYNYLKLISQEKLLLINNKIVFVFSILIIMYFEMVFHEFGHFIYGKLAKFEFYSLTIFPFIFRKNGNKIHIKFTMDSLNHPSCFMIPKKVEEIYSRLPGYFLSGIIANYIIILISSIFFLYVIKTPRNFGIEIKLLFIFICYNQITMLLNIIPMKYRKDTTDGKKLLYYIRNSDSDKREIEQISFIVQLGAGVRPRDIKFRYLRPSSINISNLDVQLDIFRYYHFLDKGDINKSFEIISFIKNSSNLSFQMTGENINFEMFYIYCITNSDIEKVKELYSMIAHSIDCTYKLTSCRIKMAYELYVNKNNLEALNIAYLGLDNKDDYPIKGMAIFEIEQIKNMMKFIEL